MLSQTYYLLRSKADGQYLVAHLEPKAGKAKPSYLLMFNEHYEALSYVNQHAADLSDRFSVESIASPQVRSILDRWGFQGVGIVKDPLVPRIEFLSYN